MNALMGNLACNPVDERGIYAVYQKGDIAALKERNRSLCGRIHELVRENADFAKALDRERHGRRELEAEVMRLESELARCRFAAACRHDSDNDYMNDC